MSLRTFDASSYVPALTPQKYGAKGDGLTDDTAAVQAAVTAAETGGGPLWLPSQFLVTSPIAVTAELAVLGIGDQCGLKAGAAMSEVLAVTGGTRHVFERFVIDGNGQATNAVAQSVAVETSVGSQWTRCLFKGATDFQMVNSKCEDITYLDCATVGDEASPLTVPHALSVSVPNGTVRIVGGEWFGRCSLDMQQAVIAGATVGPVFIDNPAARADSLLLLSGCYVYDGGVAGENCINTATNLCNIRADGCYFVPAVQPNIATGNVPAGVSVRFADCTVVQTAGLGANPVSYLLSASGAGRLIIDGGNAQLAAGGAVHAFNAIAGATTTTTTVVPMVGLT